MSNLFFYGQILHHQVSLLFEIMGEWGWICKVSTGQHTSLYLSMDPTSLLFPIMPTYLSKGSQIIHPISFDAYELLVTYLSAYLIP